jgi:hypothetical protein
MLGKDTSAAPGLSFSTLCIFSPHTNATPSEETAALMFAPTATETKLVVLAATLKRKK